VKAVAVKLMTDLSAGLADIGLLFLVRIVAAVRCRWTKAIIVNTKAKTILINDKTNDETSKVVNYFPPPPVFFVFTAGNSFSI
jgi:hypothetical protein